VTPSLPTVREGFSLRGRKQQETRRALAEAAYAVVRDVGFDGLTAEAVAARAGVSRRTFFNYYPSVESVLTASVAEFFSSVGRRLEARPAGEPVLDSALAVVADPGDGELVERIAVLAAAGDASPHARGLILVELNTWLEWLETWLRGRLGPDADDLLVSTLASSLVGAAEAAYRVWSSGRGSTPSLRETFGSALALLRAGLDPHPLPSVGRATPSSPRPDKA
jgi:AcrR family transcriptional regulator